MDLINGMLCLEEKRFSIETILNHEWVNGELPNETNFLKEMNERKVIVDRCRRKPSEAVEIDIIEAEAKITVSKQYRTSYNSENNGEIDLFESLDLSNFKPSKIKGLSNKYMIKLNDDINNSFKFICLFLKKEFNATTEIVDKTFKINSSLEFKDYEESINEEIIEKLSFSVEILEENTKGIAVFTVSSHSNQFSFKKFFEYLLSCLVGDYSSIK